MGWQGGGKLGGGVEGEQGSTKGALQHVCVCLQLAVQKEEGMSVGAAKSQPSTVGYLAPVSSIICVRPACGHKPLASDSLSSFKKVKCSCRYLQL